MRPSLSRPSQAVAFSSDSTLPEMASRILDEAPERFVLAGFSMGGMAAILAAAAAPDRVEALILIDTHADPDDEGRRAMRARQLQISDRDFQTMIREELVPVYFALPEQREAEAATVMSMAVDGGPGQFRRNVRALLERPDMVLQAQRVTARTAVVVGDQDRLAPPAAARRLTRLIPQASLTVIPSCGHLAPLEQPLHVAEVINAVSSSPS